MARNIRLATAIVYCDVFRSDGKRQRTLLKCEWEICTRLRPPDGCSAADTPHRRQKTDR
ncbi:MAG: hypothetical protein IKL41_08345 [Clostridia bacterium]|nr:hypothetical protein [Clostridia bacterium]MBR6635616.1 hypothetical protein [Clostridia bacterium]